MQASFVPIRWWQLPSFVSLSFKIVQGRDPRADHILAHPWSLTSLMAYVQVFFGFFAAQNYYILADGQRAGLLSAFFRPEFAYFLNVGLFDQYQQQGLGSQAVEFMIDLARDQGCEAWVGAISAANTPVQRLAARFGGRSLGLTTTLLTVTKLDDAVSPGPFRFEPLAKEETRQTWYRWRLYEVEQVVGPEARDLAEALIDWEGMPRGEFFAIRRQEQEIGVLRVGQGKSSGSLRISLYPEAAYWPTEKTMGLLAAVGQHFGATVRRCTLSLTHADRLTSTPAFDFERDRERERILIFNWLDDRESRLQAGDPPIESTNHAP